MGTALNSVKTKVELDALKISDLAAWKVIVEASSCSKDCYNVDDTRWECAWSDPTTDPAGLSDEYSTCKYLCGNGIMDNENSVDVGFNTKGIETCEFLDPANKPASDTAAAKGWFF